MFKKKATQSEAVPKETPAWLKRLNRIGLGKEREYLVEHFALLIASGLDVVAALQAIKQGVRSKPMKQAISDMQIEIEAGTSLWRTLEKSGLFATHIIALIRVGEESGTLVKNLQVIVEQEQKDRVFRSKLRSAMMYPVFVLGLALVIGIGIAWFVLPRLSMVFSGLNIKLPLITRLLMSFGEFMRLHGAVAIPLFVAAVVAAGYIIFVHPRTKFIGQEILFHVPGIKTLLQEIELGRFGYIFGTLLKAGLPITAALTALVDASSFRRFRRLYSYLKGQIEDGDSFAKCFLSFAGANKLIPVTMQQLIVAGEQSGRLAGSILQVGQVYEDKTETTTKNIATVLEPVLLVIVWLGVVAIALSVVLPIYSLVGGLSQGSQAVTPGGDGSEQMIMADTTIASSETAEFGVSTTLPAKLAAISGAIGKVSITPFGLPAANARAAPSLKGEIVTKLPAGGEYQYLKKEGDWYQIVLSNSSTAWINYKNVKEIR